jgi:hypothetical protein
MKEEEKGEEEEKEEDDNDYDDDDKTPPSSHHNNNLYEPIIGVFTEVQFIHCNSKKKLHRNNTHIQNKTLLHNITMHSTANSMKRTLYYTFSKVT